MHWSEKIAQEIVARRPDKEEYVCAAGISPSGSIHIGNFRDVATSYFVTLALRRMGKKARLLFSWDEYDRTRKIPVNVAKVTKGFEQYIGYPYVWGGASPETSFDCSGFVSWVYTESGVYNTGRLGATGLYSICKKITPEQVQPGDLVFFEGTMGDAADGITHVGIYVGGNHMLHCGSPIGYADLTESYWRKHFYAFGRVPYER